MKNLLKYGVLALLTIPLTEIVTIAIFLLRYLTDSLKIPAVLYVLTPFVTSAATAYCMYIVASKLKLPKAKEFSLAVFAIWLVLLTGSKFLLKYVPT